MPTAGKEWRAVSDNLDFTSFVPAPDIIGVNTRVTIKSPLQRIKEERRNMT
jgi:hypothetical protein